MKPKLPFVLLAIASTLVACGPRAPATTSPTSPTTKTFLNLVHLYTNEEFNQDGWIGDPVGNVLTFSHEVFDETGMNKVGTINGMCIVTATFAIWECFNTVTLYVGATITAQGPRYESGRFRMVVTGGTGLYLGVSGELVEERTDEEYVLRYTLYSE